MEFLDKLMQQEFPFTETSLFQTDVGKLTFNHKIAVAFVANTFCFIGNHLVIRSHQSKVKVIKFYHAETGDLVSEWPAQCQHYLPYNSLTSCKIQNTEYLLEGCPRKGCEVIRVYDLKNQKSTIGYVKVKPLHLCQGPNGSILVASWKNKTLLQLGKWDSDHGLTFHAIHMVGLDVFGEEMSSMCYTPHCDAVVLINKNNRQLKGISLASGQPLWKHDTSCGDVIPNLADVCSSPDGWICVANGNSILAMDASNGSVIKTLLEYDVNISNIKKLACSHHKITIKHGQVADNIACFDITCSNVHEGVGSWFWSTDLSLKNF